MDYKLTGYLISKGKYQDYAIQKYATTKGLLKNTSVLLSLMR